MEYVDKVIQIRKKYYDEYHSYTIDAYIYKLRVLKDTKSLEELKDFIDTIDMMILNSNDYPSKSISEYEELKKQIK